LKIIT